jgi:aminoglycoside 3-N-acetyltransferase
MSLEKIGYRLKKFLPRPLFLLAKSAVQYARSLAKRKARAEMSVIGRTELVASLRRAGVAPGDLLMVHSGLSKLGNIEGGAQTVIDSLLEAIGPAGTLLMPTYTRAEDVIARQERGETVDLRTEPSLTGKITEEFRRRPGVLRSSHPFSSVCAIGPLAEWLTSAHDADPMICHPNSPLGRFLEKNGKLLGLGVTLGPVTFYHLAEDIGEAFPFETYLPPFPCRYLDPQGREINRALRRYDPQVSATRIDQPFGDWIRDALTRHFESRGLISYFDFGAGRAWQMRARPLFDELKRLAKARITIYTREEEWKRVMK